MAKVYPVALCDHTKLVLQPIGTWKCENCGKVKVTRDTILCATCRQRTESTHAKTTGLVVLFQCDTCHTWTASTLAQYRMETEWVIN